MSSTLAIRAALRHCAASSRTAAVAPRYSSTRQYSSTVHENDPVVLENEKKHNLSKKQHAQSASHDHAPGWNEYLASASEAHVKADQSSVDVETLTTKTIKHVHERHHGDDKTVGVEAVYEREEIEGPLGTDRSAPKSEQAGKEAGAKDLSDLQKQSVKKGNTGSEEAVKADRGDI